MLERSWITLGHLKVYGEGRSTYTRVDYDRLPPVGNLDGSFAWLTPLSAGFAVLDDQPDEPVGPHLERLELEAGRAGLALPEPFTRFMSRPALWRRIPSCTACYVQLGARLIAVPDHPGPSRLLRFLNDQQTCVLWYLLLEPGGHHRVVAAAPRWLEDSPDACTLEDACVPQRLAVCAGGFEEFMKRFWLDNLLWYVEHKGRPPFEGELRAYADAVRATQ